MRSLCISVSAAALLAQTAFAQPNGAGGYLALDGQNDVVTVDADFVSQTLTLEAWLNPESLHPQWTAGIVSYGGSDRSSFDFGVGPPSDPRLRFFINWNQGQKTIVGSTPLTLEEWHHVAVTYDGETARLYIDGQLDAEKLFDTEILPSGPDALFAIGDDYPGASEFLGGLFDEVRVWSVVRSEAEIQGAMMSPLTGKEPGLVAYYNLDEIAGQMVLDKSVSGRHGRLGLSLDQEDSDPVRETYTPSRMRAMRLSSSDEMEVHPITGTVDEQLSTINAGPPSSGWQVVINRHADLHQRDAFPCGQNLDKSYVDTESYLTGADEVTLDNCGSAFYRLTFSMPPIFRKPSLLGSANVDDLAVAFVNRRPASLLLRDDDVANLGQDRTTTRHRLLNWPTTDPVFEDEVPNIVVPGTNTLTFGVCSDASDMEPAGLEFEMYVQYECVADWNADGALNTTDFTAFLNDWVPKNPETDLNADGTINTQDVLVFINAYVFGCPD